MPTKDFKEKLYRDLRDKRFASGYLSECFELGMEEFLLGLKDVVDANGSLGKLSKVTNLNRENLYKLLSDKGNPRLSSLGTILDALDIKVQFKPRLKKEAA